METNSSSQSHSYQGGKHARIASSDKSDRSLNNFHAKHPDNTHTNGEIPASDTPSSAQALVPVTTVSDKFEGFNADSSVPEDVMQIVSPFVAEAGGLLGDNCNIIQHALDAASGASSADSKPLSSLSTTRTVAEQGQLAVLKYSDDRVAASMRSKKKQCRYSARKKRMIESASRKEAQLKRRRYQHSGGRTARVSPVFNYSTNVVEADTDADADDEDEGESEQESRPWFSGI